MLRLVWRVPAQCLESCQTTQIILMMHKDVEEMEALCQSAGRDGVFKQMFTEVHRKALVSSIAAFV